VTEVNEQHLDERLGRLEKARPWSARLVSKLESHIRTATDEALFRINPFTFAKEKNAPADEVLDLFLHACQLGLFRKDWALFCPQCCCVVESLRTLRGVHNHYHCSFCQVGYETALDEYVAVSFTVDPEVREIAFHHPGRLSAWEQFIKVGNTRDGVLPDGTLFRDAKEKLGRAIEYLPPGETTRLEVDVDAGLIMAASTEGRLGLLMTVTGAPVAEPQVTRLRYDPGQPFQATPQVAPGRIVFEIDNVTDQRGVFVIAVVPPGVDLGAIPLSFVPFLTGKRLLTSQTFRDLFRSELIAAREGIGVRDITLLFTDLKESTALYDRIGDLNAFALVQQHFDRLQATTVRHGGAVIKTIGDAVMAAFLTPADAVAAALEMRSDIAEFNRGKPDRELVLKIGIHNGAAIAVTLNERLDYFGQTVNIAARVQHQAQADEIWLSQEVYDAEGVRALVEPLQADARMSTLKGVQGPLRLFCVPAGSGRPGSR
jgi:class 3 adenylate cyclase